MLYVSVLLDLEELFECLNEWAEQEVFEDVNFVSLWKFVVVSQIIVGGDAVQLVVAPEVFEVFFDLRCEFFLQDSVIVKFLKNTKEPTQVISMFILRANFLVCINYIQKVSNNIGEYHNSSKQNDSVEDSLHGGIRS